MRKLLLLALVLGFTSSAFAENDTCEVNYDDLEWYCVIGKVEISLWDEAMQKYKLKEWNNLSAIPAIGKGTTLVFIYDSSRAKYAQHDIAKYCDYSKSFFTDVHIEVRGNSIVSLKYTSCSRV